VEKDFVGMVIGTHAERFSVGANLLMLVGEIAKSNWAGIDAAIKAIQDAMMAMKYFEKPIVAAPHGMALGGGCEVCLSSHRIVAALESYMGQVEIGVGLLPAPASKEVLLRCIRDSRGWRGPSALLRKAFETCLAESTSAEEARKLGFLGPRTGWWPTGSYTEAKQPVLAFQKDEAARPRFPWPETAAGRPSNMVNTMRQAVLTNTRIHRPSCQHSHRQNVLSGAMITEQQMLDWAGGLREPMGKRLGRITHARPASLKLEGDHERSCHCFCSNRVDRAPRPAQHRRMTAVGVKP
jgi:3-hydroxyacyl-CoA dehydrogenase